MLNGVERKGEQYADDLWLGLIYGQDNIMEAKNGFDLFEQFSGLKVNFKKSVMLPIGSKTSTRPEFHCPFQWTSELIKILGIMVHPNAEIMHESDFSPLLQKIRNIINDVALQDSYNNGKSADC